MRFEMEKKEYDDVISEKDKVERWWVVRWGKEDWWCYLTLSFPLTNMTLEVLEYEVCQMKKKKNLCWLLKNYTDIIISIPGELSPTVQPSGIQCGCLYST